MIEQAFRGLLSANAGITSLVGVKIYPMVVPQKTTYPAIAYFLVSRQPTVCLQNEQRLEDVRMQLSVFGTKYEQVVSIDEAIRQAIDHYKGAVTGGEISLIRLLTSRDLYESEAEIYHRAIDYKIIYRTIN